MRLQRATPRGGGTEFSAACMRRYRSSATRVIRPLREPGCTPYMCRRGAEAPNGGPGGAAGVRERRAARVRTDAVSLCARSASELGTRLTCA